MVDEAGQHTMEPNDKSKIEAIIVMPTVVLIPLEVGGVEVVPETGKASPPWNAGTMARKATGRASA